MQTSPRNALQDPFTSNQSTSQSPPISASRLAAILLAVFYLATSLYIASHRLFWFDEFFTVRIAQLPTWAMIWTALSHAADSLPPFYYMLVRAFGTLFGRSEVIARLPSALAMAAGCF